MKEKIKKFLKNQQIEDIEVLNADFFKREIKLILQKPNLEEYIKVINLFKERNYIATFEINEKEFSSNPKKYLEFLIESRKRLSKNGSFYFENYEIKEDEKFEKFFGITVSDWEKAEILNKGTLCKNFTKITGYEVGFGAKGEKITKEKFEEKTKKNESKYNKAFEKIENLNEMEYLSERTPVKIKGEIFNIFTKKTSTKWIVSTISITDYTDSINCKFFGTETKKLKFKNGAPVKEGDMIEVEGTYEYDSFSNEFLVKIENIEKIPSLKEIRKDNSTEKRIEFHARTNMSEMCSSMSVKEYAKRAQEFGHSGMTITDLGVAYSFPHGYEEISENFKVIFGIEAYIVDDENPVVENPTTTSLEESEYVIFDIETTGFDPFNDKIIEIGAIKMKNGKVIDKFSEFINPERKIPLEIVKLTKIEDSMVEKAPTIDKILPKFLEFIKGTVTVAHNAKFDAGFIKQKALELNLKFEECVIDTLPLARTLLPEEKKHSLGHLVKLFKVNLENHHRAIDDATATAEIFNKFVDALIRKGIFKIKEINTMLVPNIQNADTINTMLLVKNQEGIKDLYELISISHIEYFGKKRPRIPKSLLRKKRNNLLIASSATASERNCGELIGMYIKGAEKEQIIEKAKFYDYIEIQPITNYQDLIDEGEVSKEKLIEMNKWFVELGKKLNKIVIAVGDTQYLDKEDSFSRNVLLLGSGTIWKKKEQKLHFSDRKLYLKTTEEMLKEFEFLGPEIAKKIVVTNTNKLAEQIEQVRPIPEGFYPPNIDGAKEKVREMTYNKMYELYGENPPEQVLNRVERELNSIINNGFAVLYLTAQQLVKKSNDLGYLVGSRGSVGSSVVAYLMGITEVNALYPHYRCPNCKHSEFFNTAGSGIDLPNKKCPVCGEEYIKDGNSIPFEVFMGFNGDKVPDIDLNFSGEVQTKVQKYTEDLFGAENVFRAGTISTIAERNAFGYVKKYLEEVGINKRNVEVARLAKTCEGARKTTGQHPGGMIVVPKGHSIYEFCPIQKPANDINSEFKTTHFDYHVMDKQLVKLDMLGHDDPTTLKQLEDMTGINIYKIPLDDKKVLSLFNSTEALGVKPEEVETNIGTSGIPEFGTSFVKQMLEDTKPTTFEELVRISGLSHGTDVWLNNAQELVKNGTAKLNEIITVRDDIMNKLIDDGLDKSLAFNIMEFVRKGRPTKEPEKWQEYKVEMQKQGIPQWYIDSCEKIKYMFPKGHATAYVVMALRIAWFKVYKPKEFYTAFLNRKVGDFKMTTMFTSLQELKARKTVLSNQNKLNPKEKQELFLYEILIEMKCRGIELEMVDLYKSNAKTFEINSETGKIRMPFIAIDGLGENVAEKIVEERKVRQDSHEEFYSQEEIKRCTGINKNVFSIMESNGCFKGIPKTAQRTLFDLF